MSIKTNSNCSILESASRRAIQLACYNNIEAAYEVLAPYLISFSQKNAVDQIFFRCTNDFLDVRHMQKNLYAILTGKDQPSAISILTVANGRAFLIDTSICPKEIFLKIFNHLSMSDLANCSQLNSEWQIAISDDALWEKFAIMTFGSPLATQKLIQELETSASPCCPSKIQHLLKIFASKCLKSNDEILERLESLLNRVSLGQNARFRCFLNFGNPMKMLTITMKGSREKLDANSISKIVHFDFKEDYFAIDAIQNGQVGTPSKYQTPSHCNRIPFGHINGKSEEGEWIIDLRVSSEGPFSGTIQIDDHMNQNEDIERSVYNIVGTKVIQLAMEDLTNYDFQVLKSAIKVAGLFALYNLTPSLFY